MLTELRRSMVTGSVLAAGLAASSQGVAQQGEDLNLESTGPLIQQEFIVGGVPFESLVSNPEVFNDLVPRITEIDEAGRLGEFSEADYLTDVAGRGLPDEELPVAGLGAALLFTAIDQIQALNEGGDVFLEGLRSNTSEVLVYTSGQIVDWSFTPGGVDENGNQRGSGEIVVETFLTTVAVPIAPRSPAPAPSTTALRWTIEIGEDGFVVEERSTGFDNYTEQPFPLSAASIASGGADIVFPPSTIARANARGFNRKIWAVGDAITVTSLERALNWPQNTTFTLLDPSQFAPYYATGAGNCFDLMLRVPEGEEIPTNVGDLVGPLNYCLGRCENPKIINTP